MGVSFVDGADAGWVRPREDAAHHSTTRRRPIRSSKRRARGIIVAKGTVLHTRFGISCAIHAQAGCSCRGVRIRNLSGTAGGINAAVPGLVPDSHDRRRAFLKLVARFDGCNYCEPVQAKHDINEMLLVRLTREITLRENERKVGQKKAL
eukprot:scaffold112868_cov31-Tisochrysis_lutea.AAC.3